MPSTARPAQRQAWNKPLTTSFVMRSGKHKIILSTGREIHCMGPNIGLSLNANQDGWRISTGFDDVIHTQADGSWQEDALTHAEAREIADYMIALWQEYRNTIPQ